MAHFSETPLYLAEGLCNATGAPRNIRERWSRHRISASYGCAYSIVKKHGGLLHLESTSAEGSAFAFYLPGTQANAIPATNGQANPRPLRFNHQRVLVMDDEAAIRDLTSQLLGTLGYNVTAVPDGLEAIRTYERALRRGEHFQAVILDATVRGGLGGVETIEQLRGWTRTSMPSSAVDTPMKPRFRSFSLWDSAARCPSPSRAVNWQRHCRSRPKAVKTRELRPGAASV